MTEEEMEGLSELGRAAVWYCEHGFGIFPIHPRTKKPAMVNGMNDWFNDPYSARDYWLKHPDHNIGGVCGTPSHGLLVLDLDVSKGKDGRATLKEWERVHGELPETAEAITGSGGRHLLFRTDRTNIRPSVNATLGVDVRCDGSYIVLPPSIHPNGERYEWWADPADVPIAVADANVYDFLDHVQRNGGTDEDKPQTDGFELPEVIKMGERDDTLYRYGCSLRTRGERDDVIQAMVEKANRDHCEKALSQRDIDRIVRQACKHGPGHDGEGTYKDDAPSIGAFGGASSGLSFRTSKGALIPNKLARLILQEHKARYIDGALAIWNGQRWVFSKKAIEYLCLEYADDAKAADRTEIVKYIEVKAPSVQSASMGHGYYVQFSNVTWDVANDCEVTPDPDMYITATLPVELDMDAPYGDADRFIESISGDDEATSRTMQEIIGACMCCKRVLSQSPMLIGRPNNGTSTASNGKSTYIDVLRAILGDENVSSMDIAALGDRFGPAELMGKLANLGDDIPDGFLHGQELSLFKKLVTGNEIKAERKYHEPFTFKPTATMVFSMNAMPRLADTTEGVFRRLAFIPFRRTFSPTDPDYDPNIIEKLTKPETLRRFAVLGIMALHDLLSEGRDTLTEIPDMVAAVEEVRTDNDVVKRWVFMENITAESINRRWVSDVYQEFIEWCKETHEKEVSQRTFTKRILVTFVTLRSDVMRDKLTDGKLKRAFVEKS